MDIATIVFGLAAAAAKTAETLAGSTSPGEAVLQVGAELSTVMFAHLALPHVERMKEALADWFRGAAPEKNQELEKAVCRCYILAQIFSLNDAAPRGSADTNGWATLRELLTRYVPAFSEQQSRGFFLHEYDERRVLDARRACLSQLKKVETDFKPMGIDPAMLLVDQPNQGTVQRLAETALREIEDANGSLPEPIQKLFLNVWFSHLCGAFHAELKTNERVFRIFSAVRQASGFAAVESAIHQEGHKTREYIDHALV